MTVTEALAELKTIGKRIEKKREYVSGYLTRQEGIKDPLEKDGGSAEVIRRERQAISDLATRHVAIRTAIQKKNQETPIVIEGVSKTVAEWLTWRKEIATGAQQEVAKIRNAVFNTRTNATSRGFAVVSATAVSGDTKPTDFVVNIDEAALAKEAELLETILGTLDGQLSLKNATVLIEV